MRPLEGKRVAITGAAGGLGTPVARLLRDAGAHVTGIDRVECPGCDASVTTDLSDDAALADLAAQLAASLPDVLVNIAGIMRFGLHEQQPIEALALCYRVNLLVPAVLANAVAGPMRARGEGHIVNIGSVLGAIPYPWFAAYSSSKAGLAALSQALRRELAGSGVAITHINPRAAKTPFNNAQVNRFLEITGMKADEPEWVASRIAGAILSRRETLNIGVLERVYAALNIIAPKLIDKGLAGQVKRARAGGPPARPGDGHGQPRADPLGARHAAAGNGERILDAGCGTGRALAGLLARAQVSPAGIDPSQAMIAAARKRLGRQANLHCVDTSAMPFADGAFDAAILLNVLYCWPPRPQAAASSMIWESWRTRQDSNL